MISLIPPLLVIGDTTLCLHVLEKCPSVCDIILFHGLILHELFWLTALFFFYVKVHFEFKILLWDTELSSSRESHPCISKLWWGKFAAPLQTTVVSVEPPLRAKGKEWCARKRAEKPSDQHAGSSRVRAALCTELSGRQCQPAEMAEQRRAEWSACQRQREHKEPTDGPTWPAASSRENESERGRQSCPPMQHDSDLSC